MIDPVAVPTQYRFDYAPNNRAQCHGPAPCSCALIETGDLRFGVLAYFGGEHSYRFVWYHWTCVSPDDLRHVKGAFPQPTQFDGYANLTEEDKAMVLGVWEDPESIILVRARQEEQPAKVESESIGQVSRRRRFWTPEPGPIVLLPSDNSGGTSIQFKAE